MWWRRGWGGIVRRDWRCVCFERVRVRVRVRVWLARASVPKVLGSSRQNIFELVKFTVMVFFAAIRGIYVQCIKTVKRAFRRRRGKKPRGKEKGEERESVSVATP